MSKEYVAELMGKEDFLAEVRKHNPNANLPLISKAYDFSKKAHEGQKRLCGRPYFMHVQEVSYMLVKLGMDSGTIAAGLLHDILEDTKAKPEELGKNFGAEILSLIEGVTKIRNISFTPAQSKAENLRKIILAAMKDVRVILIKLADRLHNMRTLKYQDRETQLHTSKETLEVYVPIAYKLGMYKLKSELEDLSFKFLEPEIYQDLKKKISKRKEERDSEVKSIVNEVKSLLIKKGINAKVYGRAKHFYSIYKKMMDKNLSLDEVHDLYAIRIITDSPDNCYRVLGIIHSSWQPIQGSFNDYIAAPKPNMYQSLHTEIMLGKEPVEVQIRTFDMHHVAEEGIAAHWRYKGTERDKRFDRIVTWLKQILDWVRTPTAKEHIEKFKIDLFKDEIFVFTPKGMPILLPEKASPVDFAYAVHSDIGEHCEHAKANGILVPLNYELNPGDIVEIITSKNAKPSRNWLNFVKTNNAKSKIRQILNLTLERKRIVTETSSEEELTEMIEGKFKKNILKMSGCCNPSAQDSIVGYKMKDGKIAVHLANCINLKPLGKEKIIPLNWKSERQTSEKLIIELVDRLGIFSDILDVLSRLKINVIGINTKTIKDKLFLIVEMEKTPKFEEALNSLKKVKNVMAARKLAE